MGYDHVHNKIVISVTVTNWLCEAILHYLIRDAEIHDFVQKIV